MSRIPTRRNARQSSKLTTSNLQNRILQNLWETKDQETRRSEARNT